MRITRCFFIVVLVISTGSLGLAFGRHESRIAIWGLKRPVRISVLAGFRNHNDIPTPAKLCAYFTSGVKVDCFQARTSGRDFFLQPRTDVVPFADSRKAVIFTARYSAGGSGSSDFWALLVFGKDRKWKNLLPVLTTSEQSEHLYWSSRNVSQFGLFSVADSVYQKGEAHFGRHHYKIETFEFFPAKDAYVLADQFVTSKKFPGLDETNTIHVIQQNLQVIREHLLNVKRKAGR